MQALLLGLGISLLVSQGNLRHRHPPVPPQETACVKAVISSDGDRYWRNISLTLTNQCGQIIDFQNASVTFVSTTELDTKFWGRFTPLPYPDNNVITSQKQADGNYLASLKLHFPYTRVANLPAGGSIVIQYGAPNEGSVPGSTRVYLNSPAATGTLELANSTAQPANVSQAYALVHVFIGGAKVADVQVPWGGIKSLAGLAPGTYQVSADNLTDTAGNIYQATVSPTSVVLAPEKIVRATVSYVLTQLPAKLAIQLQALPSELRGYTGTPTVVVTQPESGSSTTATLTWSASTTVSQLTEGRIYTFSTAGISFNGTQCTPTFTPTTLTATAGVLPTTFLTYTCIQAAQSLVTLNVTGGSPSLTSLNVTLTPSNSMGAVTKTVALSNGAGSTMVQLVKGVVYNVSAEPVAGYVAAFNPQPLTASDNAIETITLTGGTPVAVNGRLTVCGTQLCNEQGTAVQLRGMSTHGLQWYGWGNCLTPSSLDTLAAGWGARVIRIAMYVQEGGYETNPTKFTQEVNLLINEADKRGMYAIVDFHLLDPGNPNFNLENAKTFFTAIATANKDRTNMLYEIANQPNGVSWSVIKRYAETLIPIIRAIDPLTPIIVGTPGWSSLGISDGTTSQEIINSPVNATNIMYAFHFYAASHGDDYLSELDRASRVLPIFVSEWGTQTYSGDGANDFVMSEKYVQLMASKKIGWANWNYSDDFRSGAVWKEGTCASGVWTDANLKPAGLYIKGKIQGLR